MTARRVLHLIETWGPGGAERVMTDIVAGLPADDWTSVVAPIADGWVSSQARAHGATVVIIPQQRRFDIGYVVALRQLIARERIELVHAHLLMSSLYGSLAARWAGIPSLATFHGSVDVPRASAVLRLKSAILRRTVHRTIFVSEALRADIAPRLGLSADRTGLIHNGVDATNFTPGRDRALRARFGIHDDAIVLGAVGNIRASKAYDVLLHAVARLRDAGLPIHCVIAGQAGWGETQAMVDALMAQLSLESIVHFCGYVDAPQNFLRGVDLFVLSSRSEGFSIATLEAMATGLPVIATRCGGPEEIVTHGHDGLLVPVADPAALAGAVQSVLSDPGRRASLGAAARETVLRRFSSQRVVGAYATVYAELLGTASSGV